MFSNKREKYYLLYIIVVFVFFPTCRETIHTNAVFKALKSDNTGLHFTNKLSATQNFNLFKYMYFYNGGGVGAGDFNRDGLIDLFFASNQGQNKMYLNAKNLKFKEVTDTSAIPQDGGWTTGVSVVDINNDGLLDIYLCKVGKLEGLPPSHNQLLICKGVDKNNVPLYEERSHEYGLDFSGFSTQTVFFDYDNDGDLDMYLLNHTIHNTGIFGIRDSLLKMYSPLTGDRIYRNNGRNFTEVTKQTGIHSSVIGYGLGVVVSDIDLDGFPDIYIGNDFHENDYLYLNQHNGTFNDELSSRMMHTSQFSMGVDAADANNDGLPEIISVDMLPKDPYILKRSLGEDEHDIFFHKINFGYNYQYTRNNVQLNRGNGMFSELGLYAGVAATDWSWAPLWIDFDNDGTRDLFISNGIPKRMNDIDYINFVSNDQVQQKIKNNAIQEKDMALIDKFPQIKIPNKFYHNKGQMQFEDMENSVEENQPTYSNGAVYADFDNDGDLDVVVNNIDEPVVVYQNNTNNATMKTPYVEIKLKGPSSNINAIGTKVIIFANGAIRTYEKYPVRGFLSSMETPLHIGLDSTRVDSAFLIWPDNTYQSINLEKELIMQINYQPGLPQFNYNSLSVYHNNSLPVIEDITRSAGFDFLHKENLFHEFDREPLTPHMLSTEGPGLAVADINKDGLEDVFVGSSKWEKSKIFMQVVGGRFIQSQQPALEKDSVYEDVDACWADVNNDGHIDLVVASAGNEYYGEDPNLSPRMYINEGKGVFTKQDHSFNKLYVNASCIVPYDFNEDGFIDLFIGGRSVSWEYGKTPRSYLLQNDGKGKFKEVTSTYSDRLVNIGMVTHALWFDLDTDGDKDLIICLEWGGISAFINNKNTFTEKVITNKKGWWNFVLPVDINNDGKIDLIAGNLGLNSRLKATEKEPVKLYYNDFDDNGKKEQVMTYYMGGKEIPFANKAELEKQIPVLKKRFLYAEDFAKATLVDLFTKQKLKEAKVLTADYFSNALFLNKGDFNFDIQALPWQAQLTSFRDAVVINANKDSLADILLTGNFYENNIEMGRYDADYGCLLLNKGNSSFGVENLNGLQIKGQVRHIAPININGSKAYILIRNNDSAMVVKWRN